MTVSKSEVLPSIFVAALAILGGALLAIAYSNDPIWWAAWFAPAPALAAVLAAPRRIRRAVGLAIGLISGVLSFSYRVDTGSIAAAGGIAIAYAFAWGSTLKLAATVAERKNAVVATLVLPTTWAAIDTLLIHLSPHGSMGSLAYSQADMLTIQQLASLGGVPLMTFVVLLPGAAVGLVIACALETKSIRLLPQAISVAVVAMIAAILFGLLRLNSAPEPTGPVVVMIAADMNTGARRDWREFVENYGPVLDQAARPGATVLLPEAILRVDEHGLEQAKTALSALALERAATIVVGVVVDDGEISTNNALALLPDGTTSTYIKQHLVPGLERGLTPGNRDLVVRWPATGTGIAICKDMHFPALGRRYASEGARLMLVPAYDFNVDAELMMRVAAIRGIEGGYSVARAARNGMSAVTDPYGRILAERRSGNEVRQLTSQIPPALGTLPLYVRIGDLFGWLCLFAWLAVAVGCKLKQSRDASLSS
jgi:apolipoprotein N-acyltransferase